MYLLSPCVQRKFNVDYQFSRRTLGRYGLGGHAHTIKMRDLSGGQKARVVFAELSLMEPDVLVMVSVARLYSVLALLIHRQKIIFLFQAENYNNSSSDKCNSVNY